MSSHADLAAVIRSNPEVFDRETGYCVDLDTFLGSSDYGNAVEERVAMRVQVVEGDPRFVCPWCASPMFLASIPLRLKNASRFYFKHVNATSACPGAKGKSAEAINARRFNGLKEGASHKRLKGLLLESLAADPQFAEIQAEARWTDNRGIRWRQPDVQTVTKGMRVALEVQLSTTFLHVIAERMHFYSTNDGVLIWLFRDLDPAKFRLSEDDIFYANNRNAFRVTEETVALSKLHRRFAVECIWYEPEVSTTGVVDQLRQRVIYFDELRVDRDERGMSRIYFFDYQSARATADRAAKGSQLRHQFEAYWIRGEHETEEWRQLGLALKRKQVNLPDWPHVVDGLPQLLNMLYSVKHWRVVGFRYKKMLEVAHYLHDKRKDFLRLFHEALRAFDRVATFKSEDVGKKRFQEKADAYRSEISKDPAYRFNRQFVPLVSFLFPEIPESRIR